MRVVILGSGVIGVSTAWYLCQAGHDVTVVDRQPAPALETSAGNAGQISPRLFSALGRARHPLESHKVAIPAPCAVSYLARLLQ